MDGEHGPLDTPIVVMATTRRSPGGRGDVVLAHVRPSLGLSRREGRKPLCDLGIPAFGCVLIAHGRAGGGVPESAHELGQRRARLRRQYGSCVSQVVPAQIRPAGLVTCWIERLVKRARRQRSTVCGGEELSLIHISEPTRRTPISYA